MNRDQIFKEAHDGFSHKIRGHLYDVIENREDAKQIFQTIFCDFYKALETFRFKAKPSTLLYVITKRRIADYLREKKRDGKQIYIGDNIYKTFIQQRILKGKAHDSYLDQLEEIHSMNMNPLNILIALTEDETKELLISIKKTRERRDLL